MSAATFEDHPTDPTKVILRKKAHEFQEDYAWATIEDYEKDAGFQVGDAFKMGWTMARTKNSLFAQMADQFNKRETA